MDTLQKITISVVIILGLTGLYFSDKCDLLKYDNAIKSKTIDSLNRIISRLDTIHWECFKTSEIRKFKTK